MTDLLWVVQQDLDAENKRNEFLRVLDRFELPYQLVRVSNYEVDPEVTHTGKIITNGSIMLSRIANRRGWNPGSGFNEDNFSYRVWYEHLREHLLNKDCVFGTLSNIRPDMPEFFIRPVADTKVFTGRVIRLDEFDAWKADLPGDTPVLYARPRYPGMEHRHYIVGREVVSSSRYKLNGRPSFDGAVDEFVRAYAQSIALIWQPGPFWVLDTFLLGDEIGVVELGCLSHAGLYECDIQRVVDAQIEYVTRLA